MESKDLMRLSAKLKKAEEKERISKENARKKIEMASWITLADPNSADFFSPETDPELYNVVRRILGIAGISLSWNRKMMTCMAGYEKNEKQKVIPLQTRRVGKKISFVLVLKNAEYPIDSIIEEIIELEKNPLYNNFKTPGDIFTLRKFVQGMVDDAFSLKWLKNTPFKHPVNGSL